MFEVSGNDIANLSDSDLRTLVARLASAEVRAKGGPISSVTAGGNQDASDGGIDVRVECPAELGSPDFVPRQLTGFQVKKPDMPSSAITEEMRPSGVLREVIRQLAEASGAYIIVSAQGSLADKPLADRRKAMRDSVCDLESAGKLYTDFYDRDRVANWCNEYPGIVAWVHARIGRPLSGWSGIGDFDGSDKSKQQPYLLDDKACLVDEDSREYVQLTILQGIGRLRNALSVPGECVRLIGLSGLGKTRLVKALFEQGVGSDPLDSGIAIYTDYSEETNPSARDMARELLSRNQRAILIVDNCNPATHSLLSKLCADKESKISLITVEYDVRDDEPEHTRVFRLRSASTELVTGWLQQRFPDVSQVDHEKIAKFSDGNFRVAGALAETLGKGETLGSLKSRDLFERIFQQRNVPDQGLLHKAEHLSLLYSIDGEDTSIGSELAHVSTLLRTEAGDLYAALVEMRSRGVVQARGKFRAILPHAIANPLAARALERIPPADFDRFCEAITPRMLKSVSRRLAYLHDSSRARTTVERWLRKDGPLGNLITKGEDGFEIIANIAPVSPDAVFNKLQLELDGQDGNQILSVKNPTRHQWISLIKQLGYDADKFETAVLMLSRFLAAEPEDEKHNSAREVFAEFFHVYLSGTQASPNLRRKIVKQLALSNDPNRRRCASIALDALLESNNIISSETLDFGARSRDWGWQPKLNQDEWDWYDEAIKLAIDLAPNLHDAGTILAGHVRELWYYGACHEALDQAATAFSRENAWIEGWIAFRMALRFESKDMPEDIAHKLRRIISRVKPTDLLNQARAIILDKSNVGYFADGEEDENDPMGAWGRALKIAQEIGRSLAGDPEVRAKIISEIFGSPHVQRAFACGRGLAEASNDLNAMWEELVLAFEAATSKPHDINVLGGFLYEAYQRDPSFTSKVLEDAVDHPALIPILPYLQVHINLDEEGIARLRKAIAGGALAADNFRIFTNGVVFTSSPESFEGLLQDIATLPDGIEFALDILHAHFQRVEDNKKEHNPLFVALGRDLLLRADFKKKSLLRDYDLHGLIVICLAGEEGHGTAQAVCTNIRLALEDRLISRHDFTLTLKALLDAQPFVALDVFLLPKPARFVSSRLDVGTPIEGVKPVILREWADRDPQSRYPVLGTCLNMFIRSHLVDTGEMSNLFFSILASAPDKKQFLGDFWNRLQPRGWTGSLADVFRTRKAQVVKLTEHENDQVRAWANEMIPELDHRIENERGHEREREESFE